MVMARNQQECFTYIRFPPFYVPHSTAACRRSIPVAISDQRAATEGPRRPSAIARQLLSRNIIITVFCVSSIHQSVDFCRFDFGSLSGWFVGCKGLYTIVDGGGGPVVMSFMR